MILPVHGSTTNNLNTRTAKNTSKINYMSQNSDKVVDTFNKSKNSSEVSFKGLFFSLDSLYGDCDDNFEFMKGMIKAGISITVRPCPKEYFYEETRGQLHPEQIKQNIQEKGYETGIKDSIEKLNFDSWKIIRFNDYINKSRNNVFGVLALKLNIPLPGENIPIVGQYVKAGYAVSGDKLVAQHAFISGAKEIHKEIVNNDWKQCLSPFMQNYIKTSEFLEAQIEINRIEDAIKMKDLLKDARLGVQGYHDQMAKILANDANKLLVLSDEAYTSALKNSLKDMLKPGLQVLGDIDLDIPIVNEIKGAILDEGLSALAKAGKLLKGKI